MALIKCPECGKDVSTSASSCPNCGYPITEYVEEQQFNAEVERLTKKIKHVDFVCPEPRLKVCIKCGEPFYYSGNANHPKHNTPLCDCHIGKHKFPGVEVDFPEYGGCGFLGECQYVYEQCVVPNNIGDTDSEEYKSRVESLYSQIKVSEEASGRKISPIPPNPKYFGRVTEAKPMYSAPIVQPRNVPTCPICQATDLTKISGAKKAAKIMTLGIFGADDIGKTWKCNKCGAKF